MSALATRDSNVVKSRAVGPVADKPMLKQLFASIHGCAIYMLGLDGSVRSWSDAAEELKGYRSEEILGKHFSIFYPPEIVAAGAPDQELQEALEHGRAEHEGWRVRKDGSRFWALSAISTMYDEHGKQIGFCKVIQDLTERKAEEDALRDAKYRLQGIYDGCSHLVGLLSVDGVVLDANRAALSLLEVPASEVYGKHFCDTPWMAHSRELQNRLRTALELAATGKTVNLEADHPAPNGGIVHVDLRITPVVSDEGEVLYLVPEGVDVTERYEQEKKIQQYVQQLEASNRQLLEMSELVHLSQDAILSWERGGAIRSWNQGATKLYGYTAEESIGKVTHELLQTVHPYAWKRIESQILKKGHWSGRVLHFGKDGHEIEVFSRHQLIRIGDEEVILETNRDLTEWRKVVDLKGLNEKLKESNRELEQFAYVASHDLQEPLRKITAYAQLIEEDEATSLSDDSQGYLKTVLNGAKRLQQLVTDLLQFSRITTRGQSLVAVDAEKCLQIAVDSLELRIGELEAEITNDRLPIIQADESQLILLFQNLISNALKYRSDEVPRIHIGTKPTEQGYEFFVRDNGIGIESQYYEQIFEIFKRLHGRQEREGGTGIGLANCRRVVQRLGGEIWVDSTPGVGSTFYFTAKAQ